MGRNWGRGGLWWSQRGNPYRGKGGNREEGTGRAVMVVEVENGRGRRWRCGDLAAAAAGRLHAGNS